MRYARIGKIWLDILLSKLNFGKQKWEEVQPTGSINLAGKNVVFLEQS